MSGAWQTSDTFPDGRTFRNVEQMNNATDGQNNTRLENELGHSLTSFVLGLLVLLE